MPRAEVTKVGEPCYGVTLLQGSESTCECDASERVQKAVSRVSSLSTLSMFLRWPENTLILQP